MLKRITAIALSSMVLMGCVKEREVSKADPDKLFAETLDILEKVPTGWDIPERNISLDRLKELKKEQEAFIKARAKKEAEERARKEREARRTFNARFTAYYPANNSLQGGFVTATGYDLRNSLTPNGYRVVATDKAIPLHSILEIDVKGYGKFKAIVLDRGGAIKGNLLDVTFPNHETAYAFGRKTGTVKILRWGKDKWLK